MKTQTDHVPDGHVPEGQVPDGHVPNGHVPEGQVPHGHVFWRDRWYLLALLAGPLCWLILHLTGMSMASSKPTAGNLILLVLIYPLLEEFVFRAGLQTALLEKPFFKRRLLGLSVANIVTSLLFAGAHLLHQPPLWAGLIVIPSLIFGWSWERHQRLAAPVLLHAVYNAGFVYLFVG